MCDIGLKCLIWYRVVISPKDESLLDLLAQPDFTPVVTKKKKLGRDDVMN